MTGLEPTTVGSEVRRALSVAPHPPGAAGLTFICKDPEELLQHNIATISVA